MTVALWLALLLPLQPTAPPSAPPTAPPSAPPTDASAVFAQLPSDPAPAETTRGLHYWVSNETRLDLFHEAVVGRGGLHIGVGAEQNYLFAGWSKPQAMVLMDFDDAIVGLHRTYRAVFALARTPEEFRDYWRASKRPEVRKKIFELWPAPAERAGALFALATARWSVQRRLERLVKHAGTHQLPNFLTDQTQYDHVRRLWLSRQVFVVRGDLTARRTLQAIGEAATKARIPVRSLYFSNAEQYFAWGRNFRDNIKSLPFDAESVVLRTQGNKSFPLVEDGYHYNVQTGASLHAFVDDNSIRSAFSALRQARPTQVRGLSRLNGPPSALRAQDKEPAAPPVGAPPLLACLAQAPTTMACIPGGAFLRGTNTGRHRPAQPQSTVWVQTFYLDKNEVTYGEYQSCVQEGRCPAAGPKYVDFDAPQQPIAGVSWYDAKQYCEAHGKHLPTEAQWERAARGDDGRHYPWGDDKATCEQAVIMDHSGRSCGIPQRSKTNAKVGRPEPVGSRPATLYGLYDMAGNSWEWVADWYTPSWKACGAACAGIEPQGPCAGQEPCKGFTQKVVRGGSWYWPASYATTWYRRAHIPKNTPVFHHFGFRCAAAVEEARVLAAAH